MAWDHFMASVPAGAAFEPHVADAYDVTNILFSSGTTGARCLRYHSLLMTPIVLLIQTCACGDFGSPAICLALSICNNHVTNTPVTPYVPVGHDVSHRSLDPHMI